MISVFLLYKQHLNLHLAWNIDCGTYMWQKTLGTADKVLLLYCGLVAVLNNITLLKWLKETKTETDRNKKQNVDI